MQKYKLITANRSEAALHNIRATPTFVIRAGKDGKHRGDIIEGAVLVSLQTLIDQQLNPRRTAELAAPTA